MEGRETLLHRINGLLPSLNPALKKVAAYVLRNPQQIKSLKIRDLAGICDVAEATVTRFVKTIGLSSFQELKINMAEITTNGAARKEFVYDDVTRNDPIESIIEKIVYSNCEAMQDTKKLIDITEVEKAIDAIDRAEKIDIYGAGGSYITAQNAMIRFYRIGKRCIIYNDPNQQAVSASLLSERDVALGISNSGRTISTVSGLRNAKESGAVTICITNYSRSPLTEHADIKLFTSTQDSQFFQESMVSRVAQIILIDIIYAGLAVKNFKTSVEMIEKSAASIRTALL